MLYFSASDLPKAGVQPEGGATAIYCLVFCSLAVARSLYKPPKTQQKHVSSSKKY
jgi:hypothetical protein